MSPEDKRSLIWTAIYCVLCTFVFVGVATDYPSCLGNNFFITWVFCAAAVGFGAGLEEWKLKWSAHQGAAEDGFLAGFLSFFFAGWIGMIASAPFVGIGWLVSGLFFGGLWTELFGVGDYIMCARQ